MSKSIKVLIVITLIAAVVVIAVAFVSASMADKKPGGGNGQSAQSEPSQNVTQTTETVVSTTKDFLNDKDFLDAEQPFQGVERDESRTKLSLLATSVSRDLRVIVTDSRGKAVPGEKFSITIAGVGTIITAFFMGPLIEFFNVHCARPVLNGGNRNERNT